MRRGVAALAVILLLVLPSAADARTAVVAESPRPYQAWVDAAKVPTPDVVVTVTELDREDPAWPCFTYYGYEPDGCVFPDRGDIYLDPVRLAPDTRGVFLHELGHVFDRVALTDADREFFAAFIHWPVSPWLSSATHDTAGEFFAELYAFCAKNGPRYYTGLGESEAILIPPEQEVGPRRLRRLCAFMRNAYHR